MKTLKIVNANDQADIAGAILKLGKDCTFDIYLKKDVVSFLGCNSSLYIIRKSDAKQLISGEYYNNLFNGNTNQAFQSIAELKAWVELYFPVTNTVPETVQTYADLLALMPVNNDTFVTVVNDEENGTGNNDNYLYLIHTSGVITWIAAQTIN